LREVEAVDAMIHMGAHGTLEWLPGKALAVSRACFPAALLGGVPVVYPFIVNNPGEAAAAKRRLGAVTIGHLTPPLKSAGSHGAARDLERLIDEYAGADGLDRRRTAILREEILDRAETLGLLDECAAGKDLSDDDRLARLDTYLCDVKDLQIRDGLHVFGRAPAADRRAALLASLTATSPPEAAAGLEQGLDACAAAERRALIDALDGRFVEPGPAGAPTRGRSDVLPTGRNMYTSDPRAVPTHSAMVLAEKAADALMRRHLQEKGDWPRALMIDLWGSATMRTGGEDLALALVLVGARPIWAEMSDRVIGFDVIPADQLTWPRVDVTLRISGLFRDAFEMQINMFDAVVRAVARRQETADMNPLAGAAGDLPGDAFRKATTRIYGAAPGAYGAGVTGHLDSGSWSHRRDLGESYLAASWNAYGQGLDGVADPEGFSARVRQADGLLHGQDHAEVDLLDSTDYAAHEGGFAAAADHLGNAPALYHMDTAAPETPRVRNLTEEISRIVRGRASNPAWIGGMMRHGYRGGAEIARALEGLFAFAATLPDRLDRQFDLVFDATLGDAAVDEFLQENNPAARGAMINRFNEAVDRGLWQPRRNSTAEILRGDVS
ncbi:MAG: cobaltochelatase subunit CobN, partial [Rhodospirillaceae bacterium]|nr:cobaltochelatase subunit CobN [Rhodospirillaceae bacterium]